jgi:hypothetical protein
LNDAAAACLLASKRGHQFAQHIRSLSFVITSEELHEINNVLLVLAYTSRLQSLKVDMRNLPSSLFVVMGRTSISETLSNLQIKCSLESAPLHHLSPFHNLRELNLVLYGSLASQTPLSLQLPLLRHLSWVSFTSTEEHLMACRFPALRSLVVGMGLPPRVDDSKFIDLTTRFFERHDQLKQVEIKSWFDETLSVALVPLVTARHLILYSESSTPAIVAKLPACVHVLSLRYYIKQAARLFDILDALSATDTGLREVHVRNMKSEGVFSWTAGDKSDEGARVIGKMLVYAHRLGARGIRLFDQERRCALVTEAQPSILDSQD